MSRESVRESLQDWAKALAFGCPVAWQRYRRLHEKQQLSVDQDRRLITLTLAKLNEEVGKLGVAFNRHEPKKQRCRPSFGLESGWRRIFKKFQIVAPSHAAGRTLPRSAIEAPELAAQVWCVADHHDIAERRKRETHDCDAIARTLMPAETERDRIASLNERHKATLEAITGKTIEPPPHQMRHYAADTADQTAALDMMFEDVGRHFEERRDRHNDLLEDIWKPLSKSPGKSSGRDDLVAKADAILKAAQKPAKRAESYQPGKAKPGRRLTGDDLIEAIATLRPAKSHAKPHPRGHERCSFDCGRTNRSFGPSDCWIDPDE
jgi:hypothetical protein